MLAARIEQEGSLDYVQVVADQPRPRLQSGQALVRVHAAGLNNSDIAGIKGALKAISRVPRVLGRDYCGVVEEVYDAEQDGHWKGVPVWGTSGKRGLVQDGTFAEYVQTPVSHLARLPSNVPLNVAASLPLSWLCAHIAVETLASLLPADRVLVLGATGSIGSAVCQMLRARGVSAVYGTTRQSMSSSEVQPGVQYVQLKNGDSPDHGLAKATRDLLDQECLDVIIDCTGQETLVNSGISLLSPTGNSRLIMMATSNPSGQFTIDMRSLYVRSITLKGLSSNVLDETKVAEVLESIAKGFQDGTYRVQYCNQIAPVALSAGTEALQQSLHKASSGQRLVLTM